MHKVTNKTTLKDINHPVEYINFITGAEVKKGSIIYENAFKSAQKAMSTLDIICSSNNNSSKEEKNEEKNNLSELKQLKELLDMDAITKEEYDKKKKQLLK